MRKRTRPCPRLRRRKRTRPCPSRRRKRTRPCPSRRSSKTSPCPSRTISPNAGIVGTAAGSTLLAIATTASDPGRRRQRRRRLPAPRTPRCSASSSDAAPAASVEAVRDATAEALAQPLPGQQLPNIHVGFRPPAKAPPGALSPDLWTRREAGRSVWMTAGSAAELATT